MKTLYWYIGGTAAAVVVSALLAWFIFASAPAASTAPAQSTATFGSQNNNATDALPASGNSTITPGNTPTSVGTISQQKVFKISDGPVAGATFVQTLRPTTTVARFVMADNGHAFDLAIDSQGAVVKTLSNTTIPGAMSAQWAGGSALLQYLDGTTIKTVYLGLPMPSATSSAPVRVQFYPDAITALAVAPDNSAVAYLLRTDSGTAGYVSKPDGTGSKALFTLPLSQVQLRWPSKGTILAYSNAAAGVPGIAFAIDAKTGSVTPLLYAPGLTATADASFEHVLYQTIPPGGSPRTYSHSISGGGDVALSFSPLPEKCVPAPQNAQLVVCAAPLTYVPANYLDLWHQGALSAADSLIAYDLATGASNILATPGSTEDGGVGTDMLQLAISPDGRYALFISKYDRSLWGVRLVSQ